MSNIETKKELINAEKKYNNITTKNLMAVFRTIVPFGDVIDTNINEIVSNFIKQKQEIFLNEILKNDIELCTVDVNDVEFIMNFKKTLDAVNRLSNNDKIKYFANLLKNGYMKKEKISNDEYEEMLRLLNDLSYREINYIFFLYNFENKNDKENKNYWYNFMLEFEKNFQINRYESFEIYKRIANTGIICEELKLESKIVTEKSNNEEYNELLTDTLDLKYFYTTDLLRNMILLISK